MRLATRLMLAALAVFVGLTHAACDTRPETATWRRLCTERDVRVVPTTTVGHSANGPVVMASTTTVSVCTRYEYVCDAGRDGTDVCLGNPES